MPIEQLNFIFPTLVGVKVITWVSFALRFLLIPSDGIRKAEAQLYASFVLRVKVTN